MTTLQRFLLAALAATALWLLAPATPALAQQDVMRDVYGFFGSSLDVDVAAQVPGRIRFIRGRRSRIEVAGRSPNGFTSAALGGRGARRLTLTALGPDPVDFIVVVPEDVRVRINWEGSNRSELFGTLDETASYAWQVPDDRPAFESLRPGALRRGDGGARPSMTGATPRTVDIEGAHRLERLTLRIEGSRFSLSPEHALDALRTEDGIEFTAPQQGDVTIFVPRGERLTLRLDGREAIVIDGEDVRILCDAVLSQVLPDGRRWLTLTPVPRAGCSPPPPAPPAHRATPTEHRRT